MKRERNYDEGKKRRTSSRREYYRLVVGGRRCLTPISCKAFRVSLFYRFGVYVVAERRRKKKEKPLAKCWNELVVVCKAAGRDMTFVNGFTLLMVKSSVFAFITARSFSLFSGFNVFTTISISLQLGKCNIDVMRWFAITLEFYGRWSGAAQHSVARRGVLLS